MNDARDRREHPRFEVLLHVHFQQGDKPYRLVSSNLSLGGIFLKGADSICADGDRLALELVVPGDDGRAETHPVDAIAVQVLGGLGVGLRFEWSPDRAAHRAALERFIDRVGMSNDAMVHEEGMGLATDAEEVVD